MSKNDTNDWKIPLYKIYTDDEDVQLITKIVRRGSSWAIGPEIEEFEESIKNYVGTLFRAAAAAFFSPRSMRSNFSRSPVFSVGGESPSTELPRFRNLPPEPRLLRLPRCH